MSFLDFNSVPSNGLTANIKSFSNAVSNSTVSSITIFGLTLLIIYSMTKILNFYGFGIDIYGSYLAFYVFLLIAAFTLNRNYPQF
jgi:branched-subunit amino acid ABC-type transport system permease component